MNESPDNPPKCPRCEAPLPANAPEGLCPRCVAANLSAETEIKTGELGPEGTVIVNPMPTPVPSAEEVAKLFPQLEILALLGRGGMGTVYKARQPRLDRIVALKILAADKKGDLQFAERFQREARTLALLHHPNIVAIYDFGETEGNFYLLMEFVDGLTLRQLLQKRNLSPEEALAIVPKICEALQYAHQLGIVHRDIKPENILLDKRGQVKIADFGIAKIVGQQAQVGLTEEKQVIGTPHYMAPEQVERPRTVDHRADIYSLGVVLYEMLTSELPLGKFAPPSSKVQIDVRLDEVVLHALEKEPDRRYQQAHHVKTDVEAITSGSARPASAPAAIAPSSPVNLGSDKTILPAFLLAFFFGIFGAHRFFVGKVRTGFLQLGGVFWCVLLIIGCATHQSIIRQPALGILLGFSICGCGIVATIDWILILCKAFTDGEGKKITEWVRPRTMSPASSGGIPNPTPPPQYGGPSAAAKNVVPGQSAGGFGGGAGSPPTMMPPGASGGTGKIIAPGVALMIAGAWKLFGSIVALFALMGMGSIHFPGFNFNFPYHWGAAAVASTIVFHLVPGALILFGGCQMTQLQSYAWSLAAAILSILACSWIGFPIGIWALIILTQRDVREVFANSPSQPSRKTNVTPWIWGGVAVVAGLLLLVVLIGLGAMFFGQRSSSVVTADTDEPAFEEVMADIVGAKSNLLEKDNRKTNGENFVFASTATNSGPHLVRSGAAANFTKTFTVTPGGKLTLNVDRGDVHVSGGVSNAVEVRVTRQVTRADASIAAKIIREHHIELQQNGDDISISAKAPPSLSGNSLFAIFERPNLDVHYEIKVPTQSNVELKTSGGTMTVVQLHGEVKAETMGGDVEFNGIDGPADGRTMGGQIRATDCSGKLSVQTAGGEITIEDFKGPSVQAGTMGGNVAVGFTSAPTVDCSLHTQGGNVTAKLPNSAAITVDAETTGGDVSSDLNVKTEGKHHDNSLHGTMNGGGPVLKLRTLGGDIDIRKE